MERFEGSIFLFIRAATLTHTSQNATLLHICHTMPAQSRLVGIINIMTHRGARFSPPVCDALCAIRGPLSTCAGPRLPYRARAAKPARAVLGLQPGPLEPGCMVSVSLHKQALKPLLLFSSNARELSPDEPKSGRNGTPTGYLTGLFRTSVDNCYYSL